ncbi:hypothetical protein N7517_008073 [Penicillium concentricum]|uniref:Uncharacterized protein n=1 Tax=Penicillium concentricum TaxID=293559 RepID=A0A9W9V1B9_9EURO|nr:uncharacterized protein N7517_008073 [Penicillium concentricum]KAJ5365187.1 hypothetical protein N7517_008073 [Penicillium concentricum]
MICLSLQRVCCVVLNCISRLFPSPNSSCETMLFGGPDPNRSSMHEPVKAAMPMVSEEQPFCSPPSDFSLSAKNSVPIRLHTVRIWFHPNGLTPMEDFKKRGLNDVVFDAIALQELGEQHQAQDDHGSTNESFLVDLAVLEAGIIRVRREYGIIKFVPLSSDDPIVLQQSVTDPNSKKSLCYQRIHSKYQQEYERRRDLAECLGYEIHRSLKDWYDDCLRDITRRLEQLGYI